MDVSCAFPPVPGTPDHVRVAESLGYRRAWVYDTPALQLDVWAILALAARETRRIELGPGVLIPSLRHVMVTAAAIATLADLAPGRVNVGIGSGFTGRLAMGRRPNRWSFIRQYALDLRRLLAGEAVEVDGALTRMLHGPGQAPPRPIRVPFLFGIGGPKGEAVAREIGDGVLTVAPTAGFAWSAMLACGTVLAPGEALDAPRVLAAAGAGAAVVFHRAWDTPRRARSPALDELDGGPTWREAIAALPVAERHLHTHYGHLTFPNEIDRPALSGEAIRRFTFTGEPDALRRRMASVAERGVTELVFQPAGPDIAGELERFAAMAELSGA